MRKKERVGEEKEGKKKGKGEQGKQRAKTKSKDMAR